MRKWSFLIGVCGFPLLTHSILLPVPSYTSFLFLVSTATLGFRCFFCMENPLEFSRWYVCDTRNFTSYNWPLLKCRKFSFGMPLSSIGSQSVMPPCPYGLSVVTLCVPSPTCSLHWIELKNEGHINQ